MDAKFEHHVFICTNDHDKSASRPSCAAEGSEKLKVTFKDAIEAAGLKGRVRADELGCLNQHEHGPICRGPTRSVWYGFVHARHVAESVQEHLLHGRPVERLRPGYTCLNTERSPHKPLSGASKSSRAWPIGRMIYSKESQ